MNLSPLPLTLRQLQYVVAVAYQRNFRKAAEACHVSQPSLSAQVAELETALGVQLFERQRRGVLLTAAGETIVNRARRTLVEARDLADAAMRFVDPLAGTLRIGLIPTIAPYLLPEISSPLQASFPKLTLLWTEEKTDTLVQALGEGEQDAAIVALEAELGDLDHEVLFHDPFLLAAPRGHRLGRSSQPVTLEELGSESVLLLNDGHCFREQALAICKRSNAEEAGFRATSLPTLVQMVASGVGITLLPRLAVAKEGSRSQLVIRPIEAPAPGRTVVMVWRRNSPLASSLRALSRSIRTSVEKVSAL